MSYNGQMEERIKGGKERVGGFLGEFWKFAAKGNVFDLAVAVILGNAFSGVVNSLVNDVLMPILSIFTNNVNLSTFSVTLRDPVPRFGTTTPSVVLHYGHLLQAFFNFVVIAFSIFLMFKVVQSLRKRLARKEEEGTVPPPEPSKEEQLLTEIRDVLKRKTIQ